MDPKNGANDNPNDDAQKDEQDSMEAIFADDFSLLGQEPISYSIRLRPDLGACCDRLGISSVDDVGAESSSTSSYLSPPDDLALVVTYPRDYPDADTPIFSLAYDKSNGRMVLHDVQERALLKTASNTAQAELGMPSVYSCVHAVQNFLEKGGLDQAGVALLPDDCLAHILAYRASAKEDVDSLCTALPIFEGASKSNVVWRQLCRIRWEGKWGFEKRWEQALAKFQETQQNNNEQYWMEAYQKEELDSKRMSLPIEELCCLTFDFRQWFSFARFRNQQENMRDVLPTGLRESFAQAVFDRNGTISSERDWLRSRLVWKSNNDKSISQIRLKVESSGSSVEHFTVRRTNDWGWELWGGDYILRAVDRDNDEDLEKLWLDMTSNIIVDERPEWIQANRGPYPYNFREIPDDEDCKLMLDW